MQALHTFIDTLPCPFGAIVPEVHAVLAIAAHFRGEVILVAGNLLESLTQHRLRFRMSIIGRHVDEVDTIVNSRMHGTDAFLLTNAVEHPS